MDAKGKEHAWGGWEGGEDRSFQVLVKSVIVCNRTLLTNESE